VRGEPDQKGGCFCVGGVSHGVAGGKKVGDGEVGSWESVGSLHWLGQVEGFWAQTSLGVKKVGQAQGKMLLGVL